MVVLVDEILHIPLLCVRILCNHKLSTASTTSDIPRPPLLDLPPHLLLCAETFTAANKLPKGPLIVAVVPLAVFLSHTKSFLISVVVIKLKSVVLTAKHLHNNFTVLQQRIIIDISS